MMSKFCDKSREITGGGEGSGERRGEERERASRDERPTLSPPLSIQVTFHPLASLQRMKAPPMKMPSTKLCMKSPRRTPARTRTRCVRLAPSAGGDGGGDGMTMASSAAASAVEEEGGDGGGLTASVCEVEDILEEGTESTTPLSSRVARPTRIWRTIGVRKPVSTIEAHRAVVSPSVVKGIRCVASKRRRKKAHEMMAPAAKAFMHAPKMLGLALAHLPKAGMRRTTPRRVHKLTMIAAPMDLPHGLATAATTATSACGSVAIGSTSAPLVSLKK